VGDRRRIQWCGRRARARRSGGVSEIPRRPGALWLAQDGDEIVGCVALRPLPEIGPRACEVKRLYVRPAFRGAHVAGALMDALETHARGAGYDAVYLDSKDDLATAIRFYERRGYERIAPYNDNPQATVFMRRPLA